LARAANRSPRAKDIKRRFLPDFHRFHKLAMERERQREGHVANQQQAGKLIAEAFDCELRRERVHFGNVITDGAWGYVEVSGTVMMEMRNVPMELAVQIGELLKEASNLCGG
jgi:hypothetical protein